MSTWRKASGCEAASCIEVKIGAIVSIRDNVHPEYKIHTDRTAWRVFIEAVKRGEFDLDD